MGRNSTTLASIIANSERGADNISRCLSFLDPELAIEGYRCLTSALSSIEKAIYLAREIEEDMDCYEPLDFEMDQYEYSSLSDVLEDIET